MTLWLFGNTTVRSPFRLRDGLVALSKSPLQGALRRRGGDMAFRDLLGAQGIVTLGADSSNSVGRKWRSALGKLGYLYPVVPRDSGVVQEDLGTADTITPNGRRLIEAPNVPAMQECFLRSLAAYYIPTNSNSGSCGTFSPLKHVLAVMLELERQTNRTDVSFHEMALVLQVLTNGRAADAIVSQVLELRSSRIAAQALRQFDRQRYELVARENTCAPQTLRDYADTNIRYLKATGLVRSSGKGIAIVPEKRALAIELAQDQSAPDSALMCFRALCNGAVLPTDNEDSALVALHDLLGELYSHGIPFSLDGRRTDTPADIGLIRHEMEELLANRREEEYASRQASDWEDIAAYMNIIAGHQNTTATALADDARIEVPRGEAPAYLEWVIWRAFLAIDSMANKPYDARRFKIDQDFLPISTAPGNGPDMTVEFEDCAIVVEVTLTDSSRQEAAEGEPVRRHVAQEVSLVAEQSVEPRPVYCLFIAKHIDLNTAETFRSGAWYMADSSVVRLAIVPLTLSQFQDYFVALFQSHNVEPALLRGVIESCSSCRTAYDAPGWKRRIDEIIRDSISSLRKQARMAGGGVVPSEGPVVRYRQGVDG